MRIGLFGGSFDPIHMGHAMLANMLSQCGEFDEVWLMPGRINPLKTGAIPPASIEDRLAMAALVARKCAAVRVCDIETSLPEPSYTIVTLEELSRRYPEHSFRMIIGSDNWQVFDKWREPERILNEYGVTIYERPGYEIDDPEHPNVSVVRDMPQMMVSSTYVRRCLAENRNVNYIVPEAVVNYIHDKGLYGTRKNGTEHQQ